MPFLAHRSARPSDASIKNTTGSSLLKGFGDQASAPPKQRVALPLYHLLVNISFNLFGEPLVVNSRNAARSCSCLGIDALVINGFVLSKAAAKIASDSVSFPKASSA